MNIYFWFCLFVVVNALILLILAANVSRMRMALKIPVGDGGNIPLEYAIRAHGNGLEQMPVFALLLLCLTLTQSQTYILAGLVIVFSLARLLHAYGMLARHFVSRRIGAGLTYLSQFVAIVALLFDMLKQ